MENITSIVPVRYPKKSSNPSLFSYNLGHFVDKKLTNMNLALLCTLRLVIEALFSHKWQCKPIQENAKWFCKNYVPNSQYYCIDCIDSYRLW